MCEAGVQTDIDTEEADEAELHGMLSKLHGSVSLLIGLYILYWFVFTYPCNMRYNFLQGLYLSKLHTRT